MKATDNQSAILPESISLNGRVLPWEACANARELGGYPAGNGSHIRWRALVRSDTTYRLTPSSQQALIDYGIRTEIDLRFEWERKINPSPFERAYPQSQNEPPDYINIPLDEDQNLEWPSQASPAEMMSDLYRRILETNRHHVAAVLSAIAQARPGGILIHCHAGKDRTGLIVALILAYLGVPDEIIVQDYASSYPLLARYRTEGLSDPALTPDRRAYLNVLFSAPPEAMVATLAYLVQRYGGVQGYLRSTPASAADLTLLRQRLLD